MKHVLGVDGGGTKTTARLLEVGPGGRLCLIASGHAGGSNPFSVGWDAAEAAVAQAVAVATDEGGVAVPDAAVIAVAGCASPTARDRLTAWAEEKGLAESISVVADTEPLLADAPVGEASIGLIAGTGSSALIRRADGQTESVGGWGYLIDDGGSGYAIGRDALKHVAAEWDAGRRNDPLTQALLEKAGLDSPPDFKAALYGADDPRGWAASLAPVVLDLAESFGSQAAVIATDAAAALALLAANSQSRLKAGGDQPTRLFLAGGVLLRSAYYRELVISNLTASGWQRDQVRLAPDAACGCGLLAARNV